MQLAIFQKIKNYHAHQRHQGNVLSERVEVGIRDDADVNREREECELVAFVKAIAENQTSHGESEGDENRIAEYRP